MGDGAAVLHLFLVNVIAGQTNVFLVETEPGVVEFPRLQVTPADMDDEDALCGRVLSATGMEVAIGGFLDPPPGAKLEPPGSRVLLARFVSGTPHLTAEHVGWEWTSGAELLRAPFAPKLMLDELKSFMNI